MITNKRQLKISKAALRDFENSLAHLDARGENLDLDTLRVLRDSVESEIEILRGQITEYEAIEAGIVACLPVEFDKLGEALIRARIAANLTQKQLAEKVGVKPQQIQKYEAGQYEGASFARLKEMMWALGVEASVQMDMPNYKQDAKIQDDVLPGLQIRMEAYAEHQPAQPAGLSYRIATVTEADAQKGVTNFVAAN